MKKEAHIKIKNKEATKIRNGYPLISKEALVGSREADFQVGVVKVYDEKNQFVAIAYCGKQNKGYGWVLSNKEGTCIDKSFFQEKLKNALDYREEFFQSEDTTAFRVFNGEGDGVGGLIIDYYEGHYVISWYNEGIYSMKQLIVEALIEVARPKSIYQKKRFDVGGQYIEEDDFVWGEVPTFPLIIKENGVNFAVDLNDGAMVGIFLDQREVRKHIRDEYAKDRTVLNTFSYTGAFSVCAALGGASSTTSVDLANRSLPKTSEQFSVNGVDPQSQQIIVQDVFKYFKYAVKKEITFDTVILDPPSFARAKKFTFSASKDYKDLLREAIRITNEEGVIVASTNCSNFDLDKFYSFIDTAFREEKVKYTSLKTYTLPKDFKTLDTFKEGNYLKVVFIKRGKSIG